MATSTPWGTADYSHPYLPGVTFYGTPSHGGFRVTDGRARRIPAEVRASVGERWDGAWWFEEDCAWAFVALAYPEAFARPSNGGRYSTAEGVIGQARECVERWYPELLGVVEGQMVGSP